MINRTLRFLQRQGQMMHFSSINKKSKEAAADKPIERPSFETAPILHKFYLVLGRYNALNI